jgi:TRAP-type C4-dicarboxylate transport system substrate-binding protein
MRLSELTAQEERQGAANDYIREVYEKAGFYYLGRVFPSNIPAFWVFTNKRAMKKEDFAGMKIAGSPSFFGFFKALGAAPTNVGGLKDYYTGMERGVLDAHVGSIGVFIAIGSFEVTKYVIDHPYYMNGASILMNLKKWNSLPKHLQRIMMDTAIELETAWKPVQEKEEGKLRQMAEKKGVEFYKLPPDIAEWYLNAAYEGGWESDTKKYPPDVVAKFKELLQK